MALNIAQDDTRELAVPADGDVADIAAFGAVGGAAVNADYQARRADFMAGVLVPTPNTIANEDGLQNSVARLLMSLDVLLVLSDFVAIDKSKRKPHWLRSPFCISGAASEREARAGHCQEWVLACCGRRHSCLVETHESTEAHSRHHTSTRAIG